MTTTAPKLSKVEGIKDRSQHLLEPIFSELKLDTTHFSEDGVQILKFHGSYQQDNRDERVKGQEKPYSMMLRLRSPGGYIPPQLYLALDNLADEYGNGTLRATTRQAFQLHGVLKKNLKTVIGTIIRHMGSTLGACGDLNRNIMAPPVPYRNRPEYALAQRYANNVADLLTPQTGAYYEIWTDGEKIVSGEEAPEVKAARQRNLNGTTIEGNVEPIYGDHYMPRKFKMAVTVPGDNSVDLFTQDVGLVLITDAKGKAKGFNVYAGGGMGRTHNKEETFARVADPIGYVDAADVYDLVKAIVAVQRDYGDRVNRRHARMKYLINDWGVAKFTAEVEKYFGKAIQPLKKVAAFEYRDYLGWQEQGDGKWFLGLSVQNGRVKDVPGYQLKAALKEIVSTYQLPILLTRNQDIILSAICPLHRAAIDAILNRAGVKPIEAIDPLARYSIACPALPTCGLAVTESERAIPGILERIRGLLDELDLPDEHFVVRMTGCPNGCARPYMAEVGFVGQGPNAYQLWLGGSPNQTRLAQPYLEKLADEQIEATLRPLLVGFKAQRKGSESFGDFCNRVGFEKLRRLQSGDTGEKPRYRVGLREDIHSRLKAEAEQRGVSLTDLATEAIAAYLQ